MFLLIWGSRARETELARGRFFCPGCQEECEYVHKKVDNDFTVYFIPVYRKETLGESIECRRCHQTYTKDVLSYRPVSRSDGLLFSVCRDLESGTPIEMVKRKLMNSGVDQDAIERTMPVATGGMTRSCSTCDLTYVQEIDRCANCGAALAKLLRVTSPKRDSVPRLSEPAPFPQNCPACNSPIDGTEEECPSCGIGFIARPVEGL